MKQAKVHKELCVCTVRTCISEICWAREKLIADLKSAAKFASGDQDCMISSLMNEEVKFCGFLKSVGPDQVAAIFEFRQLLRKIA